MKWLKIILLITYFLWGILIIFFTNYNWAILTIFIFTVLVLLVQIYLFTVKRQKEFGVTRFTVILSILGIIGTGGHSLLKYGILSFNFKHFSCFIATIFIIIYAIANANDERHNGD